MSDGLGQINLSCLKTFLADVAKEDTGDKSLQSNGFDFLSLQVNFQMHLQHQILLGVMWRSVP